MEMEALVHAHTDDEIELLNFDATGGSGSGENDEEVGSWDLEEENVNDGGEDLSRLSLEPYEGMEFKSEESSRIFYNSYARRVGFSIRASTYHRSRRDGSIICRQIVCSRQGYHHTTDRDRGSKNKHKRPRAADRVGCKAMIVFKKQPHSGHWVVSKLCRHHNHDLVPPDQVHRLRSHRQVSPAARSLIDTLRPAGICPAGVMSVLARDSGGIHNLGGFTTADCRNYITNRQRTLPGLSHHLFHYFKTMQARDASFFYSIQGENELSPGNIFWADAACTANHTYFGDTVTFDTTYRTNRYRVPFAPFTGLNHHGNPVLFGCALLLNESESSFIWLFQTWLAAMSGRQPVSITTDQDRVIQSAVAHVFPNTRHRFCKFNIFREAQQKLSTLYHMHPSFELEFHKCINMTETIQEFESSWGSLLDKYSSRNTEWLQSMYLARQNWVPVYLRDTFFGELSTTQGTDTINSFFDGYVNASTTIQVLVKQYEKAVASRHEKEVKADHDTINTDPILKTPSPIEKQAADIYTRIIFMKFQDELVETLAFIATKIEDTGTLTTYRVAKFEEPHKAYTVKFHVFEMNANCSCKKFEFSGIICRHILAVFRVTNFFTLPSHYILKRWTRNGKSGVLMNEHALELPTNSRESSIDRFNNLRQEAIKYVDEGAKSSHAYSVAMDALKEAAKKVRTLISGGNQELRLHEASRLEPLQLSSTDDKDKKILELMGQLEVANQRCEVYKTNLLAVLKDMEEQKLKLSVKVQSVRLSLND